LAAAYKRYQLDLQAGPSTAQLLLGKSRIPNIKAYEKLVTALFLNPKVSSVRCEKKEMLIGDINPRLYALGLLFLSASGVKRQPNDGNLALSLSGPSSYGKSKLLDGILCDAKVISQDARGVGRYSGKGATCFYYSDIVVSDILGQKADINAFKHLARAEPLSVKVHGSDEACGPKWVCISSNECFLTHSLGGKVIYATKTMKRGVEKDSVEYRDHKEHDSAIRCVRKHMHSVVVVS
jgi:hypothetical protein